MQSSKPVQAGIIVAANYAKNTVCWPIIAPFRQTRRVITCQVLRINTVLVKYYRITMQIQRTQGVLPHVGYNTLTLGARGFSCAFPVSASSESNGHESVALGEKARRKYLKTFVTPFLLTRLTAPMREKRKENLWYPRPGYNTLHICCNTSHFTPTPTLIHVSPICKYTRISTLGKERTSKLEEK